MKEFWKRHLGSGVDRAIRLTLLTICALMTLWFILPVAIYGVLNIGNLTGVLLGAAAYLFVLFFSEIRAAARRLGKKRIGRVAVWTAAAAVAAAAVCAVLMTIHIAADAVHPPEGEPTVVVLGCQVYGTRPSLMLRRRIDAAADYLAAHPDAVCVLSGGQGEDEEISEAQCMFDELCARGIDPARLLREDRSTSTRENIAYSMELIRARELPQDLCIVTNEFHQCRAKMIAQDYAGQVYAVSAPSPVVLLPTYVVREWYAIMAEKVFR